MKDKLFEKSEGAIRFYYHDHKNLPQTEINNFTYFLLTEAFIIFGYCKTEANIHSNMTGFIEDV